MLANERLLQAHFSTRVTASSGGVLKGLCCNTERNYQSGRALKPQWIKFRFLRYSAEFKVSLLKELLAIVALNATLQKDPQEQKEPHKPECSNSLKQFGTVNNFLLMYSNSDSVNA